MKNVRTRNILAAIFLLIWLLVHTVLRFAPKNGANTNLFIDFYVVLFLFIGSILCLFARKSIVINVLLSLFVIMFIFSTRNIQYNWEKGTFSQRILAFNYGDFAYKEGEYCLKSNFLFSEFVSKKNNIILLSGPWPIDFKISKLIAVSHPCEASDTPQ